MKLRNLAITLLATLGLSVSASAAQTVTGAGASFPAPVYAQWAAAYNKATGNKINYQSIGSSGGIKQITSRTVDFGASDAPMSVEDLQKNKLVQFPTVIGGVVPVVNIPGIEAGQLKLTGDILADIYLGKIKKWDDERITKLNPDLKLPSLAIATVFRADGSGTTFIFTHYLSQVSEAWKTTAGEGKTIKWPTSKTGTGIAGKGNEGVATSVKRLKGGLGYVEYAYAKQNKMASALLQNKVGKFVAPSAENFAAAADVDWKGVPGFSLVLTNQGAEKAWPIAAATFILIPEAPKNAETAKGALEFFDWAYKSGDDQAKNLDYVPLPESAKELIRAEWKKVQKDGKAVY